MQVLPRDRKKHVYVGLHSHHGRPTLTEPKLWLFTLAVYIAPLRLFKYINTLGDCSASNVTHCHMKA